MLDHGGVANKRKPNKPKSSQAHKPNKANKANKAKPTSASAKPTAGQQPQAQAAPAGERKLTREERWEAARKAKRRKALVIRAISIVAVVAVVGGIAAWQIGKRRSEQKAIAAMTAGTCEFDRKTDEGAVNEHAPNPRFTVEPPSGGVHSPNVASPGVFLDGTPPPDAQLVHALEHGDIAIWVRPDVPDADVDALRTLADEHENDVLLISRPNLPVPVAATAWHKRLLCEKVERAAFKRFIERWHDKGPEGQTD